MASVQRLRLEADVLELARDLKTGQRRRPAVVVSVPGSRASSWIDAQRAAQELDRLADVFLLESPAVSWTFTDAMPNDTSVYGGAARVYPTALSWVRSPLHSRLFLAYDTDEGERATTALIEAALDAAADLDPIDPAPPTDQTRPAGPIAIPKPSDVFPSSLQRPASADHLEAQQPAQQPAQQSDAPRKSPEPPPPELDLVTSQLTSAKRQISAQERDLREERASRNNLEKDLAHARRMLRDAERRARPGTEFLFVDREEQFRYGVYDRWVHRIPAGEKADRKLAEYRFGSDFFGSLDQIDSIAVSKIYDVVVEVLTGMAEVLPGRDMHRLRHGLGGADPVVSRNDGAVCWRVALQKNTPSARRMHFWRHADYIELSRVVLHDDWTP